MKLFKLEINQKRIFGLDLLRCVAIMLVMIYHSAMLLPESISKYLHYIDIDGVSVFFVLSGFLIGGILLKIAEKDGFKFKNLYHFWLRRWIRTLPNYFLFLFTLAILNKIFVVGFPLSVTPQYAIFFQNIFSDPPGFFQESWSLSVEEWFYLTIPLLLLITIKCSKLSIKKLILLISINIIICSIILRFCLVYFNIVEYMGNYNTSVIMRLDNIMYGVFGAYVHYYYNAFWLKYKKISLLFGFFIIIGLKFLSMQEQIIGLSFLVLYFYPILCIGVLLLLPFLSTYSIKKKNILTKAITVISLISYSLYLINYSFVRKLLIENIFSPYFNGDGLEVVIMRNLFFWTFSILASILIYKYFEIPVMKIRDRISPKTEKKSNNTKLISCAE